jgi:hypothetical protein
MNQELLNSAGYKITENCEEKLSIVMKKGILWTTPLFLLFYYGIYAGISWTENNFGQLFQVVLISAFSIIPILTFLGLLKILIYKIEIYDSGITIRDLSFPSIFNITKLTNIQPFDIKTVESKNEKKRKFQLIINTQINKHILFSFNERKDKLTFEKVDQIRTEIAKVISRKNSA